MIKRNKEMFIFFGLVLLTYILGIIVGLNKGLNNKVETPKTTEQETTTEIELETETETEIIELATQKEVETEVETETETEPQYVSLGIYTITAYCSCHLCCGKYAYNRPLDENGEPIVYGASGEELIADYSIAVDAELFQMGETLWINNRQYVCHDVGSAIKGKKIDIYMSSHQRALEWGRQNVEVFKVVNTDVLGMDR